MSGNTDNGFEQPVSGSTQNAPRLNKVLPPLTATFVDADGGSNIADVTIQWKDGKGNNIAFAVEALIWLSDAATGVGVTATAASGTVTARSASGVDMGALTAKKVLVGQSLADGSFVLEITDTANTGFFVAVQNPFTGETFVSDAIAGYGA